MNFILEERNNLIELAKKGMAPENIIDAAYLAGLEAHRKEIVICAAVKMPDGFVVRGHRHNDCYHNLAGRPKYKDWKALDGPRTVEGFITSHNRFVDRTLGRHLQDLAGIPSADKDGYRPGTLYSEDLY